MGATEKSQMYLKRRNGYWVFRRPIPKNLQPFIVKGCRTEILISLKTKDSKEASRLYGEVLQESEWILEDAENLRKAANGRTIEVEVVSPKQTNRLSRKPLYEFSRGELEQIVRQWFEKERKQAIDASTLIFNFGSRDDVTAELETIEQRINSLERNQSATDDDLVLRTQLRLLVDEARGKMTAVYPTGFLDTLLWFKGTVREGLLTINRACSSVLKTGSLPEIEKPIQIVQQSPSVVSGIVQTNTINDLIDQFDKDPKNKGWEQKTRDEFNLVYDLLREFIVGSTPVAAIQRKQIKDMRDLYTQMPLRSALFYKGKTIKESVAAGQKDGRPVISTATFNKRMSLLSTIFCYAVREQFISLSPAEGLSLKEDKKELGKSTFTPEQLEKIFAGKIYQGFLANPRARFTPNHGMQPHEFWVPLIALYQGFRMGEILQLRARDIGEQDGIPCIHIREGDDGQSVKTQASIRVVPVHPTLIAMGFLNYVKATRIAGLSELFPEATKGQTYGNKSHNYSKRFNRYLVQIGVKTGPDQKFHSFRHTFRDGLATADVPKDVRRALGGWSDDDSSLESQYGGRLMPHLLKHLSKLQYEGLDLERFIVHPKT